MIMRNAIAVVLFLLVWSSVAAQEVPDFRNMTTEEAEIKAQELGFVPTIELNSSTERLGRVYSQIPGPGSLLEGGEVLLRVSNGLKIPPLVNLKLSDATALLDKAGLGWSVTKRPEPGTVPGLVTRTVPGVGGTVDATIQIVFLTVSDTEMITVPSAGKWYGETFEIIKSLGLVPVEGEETAVTADEVPDTKCLGTSRTKATSSMNPPQGTEVPKGSTVVINYSTHISHKDLGCNKEGTLY